MDGIESQRRNRSAEDSLQVWEEMQQGSAEGLKNCMRWKISMTNPNKAMRDPVAYRCNLTPHHRTGTKYKVGWRLHRGIALDPGWLPSVFKARPDRDLLGRKGRPSSSRDGQHNQPWPPLSGLLLVLATRRIQGPLAPSCGCPGCITSHASCTMFCRLS